MENMCVELLAGSCQCHQSVMNQSWMFMPAAPYRENNNQTCFHRGGEVRHQASRHPQLNLPPITPTTSGASKGPGKMAPIVSELNQTKARFQSANFEWQIQQGIRPITPPTHFYWCSATECKSRGKVTTALGAKIGRSISPGSIASNFWTTPTNFTIL